MSAIGTITVLTFAGVRDLVGTSECSLELAQAAPLSEVLEQLVARWPALEARLPTIRVAVNENFATTDQSVAPGDVVALLPPVCGG